MNKFWKLRHRQHESGWFVVLDGERIAELDYLHDCQPCHLFKVKFLTLDEPKIDYGLRATALRPPEERLVFKCRNLDIEAVDLEFFVGLYEDGTVGIRDMRPGPPKRKWWKPW